MVALNPSLLKGLGKAGLIFIIAAVVVALAVFAFLWIANNQKNKKKFRFILVSTNGQILTTMYGLVRADPQNPAKKKFFFADYDTQLEIQAPSLHFDGSPARFVTFNHLGELNYIEDIHVDKEKYLKVALKPEEKAITLHRYKEQQLRFQNQFDKAKTTFMILAVIMVILVLLAVVGSIYVNWQTAKTFAGVTKDLVKIEDSKSQDVAVMKEIAEIQASTQNGSFSRTLS